ncbi:cell wall hydrolase [Parasphingorhabdus sp. DH2-15]|uniref:cell wall hydrolase n=1 Tax=Parasphingorhabdus sp. DH2-15 TaxID=3444112 RepID=UPI003F684BF6
MSKVLKAASAVAIAASTLSILANSDAGLAFQQSAQAGLIPVEEAAQSQNTATPVADNQQTNQDTPSQSGGVTFVEGEVVQALPEDYVERSEEELAQEPEAENTAASLRELVSLQNGAVELSEEMRCLAGAVYFESKGEPLLGQLAVAKVVINRAKSSRFPNSYCGVVYQKRQFSFVRGGRMPRIRTGTRAWRNAKAIAQIADQQAWSTPVDNALFFHARRISPRWRLTRVGTVGNHVFYR